MNINFAMWGKALSQLIKMDDKKEWDALDVVSKWLIATRSAVTTVTIYSCVIAGLLAWRFLAESNGGAFPFLPWVIVTLGLFIAHGTNNILNDYTDFSRGIDKDNYFRTQYGVHPLVQGFWDKKTQLRWFFVSGVIAFASGIFALWYTGFDPVVLGLFAIGIVTLLFYTYPLKYVGVGELTIFLIWGPLFVGKHTDKLNDDRKKHVRTLPVLIGEKAARYVTMAAVILAYAIIIYLIFVPHFFTPLLLIVLFAGKRALLLIAVLTKPRPSEPPKEWPGWPTWFSGFAFYHNRLFGNMLILGIVLDTLVRFIPLTADFVTKYWPM
jgi:1,4-dihydroxy-2-naphthoate octaprenyltransferase